MLLRKVRPIKNFRVLDVGCGSGRYIRLLSKEGAKVIGIDISNEIIDRCRRNFPDSKFYVLPVEEINSELGLFDLIVSSTVLQHVPDENKQESFLRIANIIRPGGHLLIIENQRDKADHIHGVSLWKWQQLGEQADLVLVKSRAADHRHLVTLTLHLCNVFHVLTKFSWWKRKIGLSSKKINYGIENSIFDGTSFRSKIYLKFVYISVMISYALEPLFNLFLPISYARHVGLLFRKSIK